MTACRSRSPSTVRVLPRAVSRNQLLAAPSSLILARGAIAAAADSPMGEFLDRPGARTSRQRHVRPVTRCDRSTQSLVATRAWSPSRLWFGHWQRTGETDKTSLSRCFRFKATAAHRYRPDQPCALSGACRTGRRLRNAEKACEALSPNNAERSSIGPVRAARLRVSGRHWSTAGPARFLKTCCTNTERGVVGDPRTGVPATHVQPERPASLVHSSTGYGTRLPLPRPSVRGSAAAPRAGFAHQWSV